MDKSLIQSKTFWTNLLLAVLPLFPSVNGVISGHPEYLAYAFAAINIVLRVISKDKISGLLP